MIMPTFIWSLIPTYYLSASSTPVPRQSFVHSPVFSHKRAASSPHCPAFCSWSWTGTILLITYHQKIIPHLNNRIKESIAVESLLLTWRWIMVYQRAKLTQVFQRIQWDSLGFWDPTWLRVKRDLYLQEIIRKSIQFYMLLKAQVFLLWISMKFCHSE